MFVFDDIEFKVVCRQFIMYSSPEVFYPKCNSIEFLRSGHLWLEADGRIMELQAPVLFWMRQGHSYRFIVNHKAASKPCDHIYCDCSGPRSERMIEWLDASYPNRILVPVAVNQISEAFFEILKYFRLDKNYHFPEMVESYVRLMVLIANELRPKQAPAKDPYGIIQISEEIRKDPFQTFNFHAIAAQYEVTYDHFRKLFRQMHKMTPPEYVRRQKMMTAADLLTKTTMRIKEIMYTCRYTSLMDFSRSFKRYFNLCPRDYRLKYRETDYETRPDS